VVNVPRYYHHETVQMSGRVGDVRSNVRGGLDITRAENYGPGRSMLSSANLAGARKGRSGCIEGRESLRKAGFLHRDIPINNLMINENGSKSFAKLARKL